MRPSPLGVIVMSMRRCLLLLAVLLVSAPATSVALAATQNGTRGPDSLQGGPEADLLSGRGGDDRLIGAAGDDVLNGGSGDDLLGGDAGDDILRGGPGADTLLGGGGNDRLVGGPGMDIIVGGAGNDRIFARDGEVDRISCGPGRRDRVEADRVDRVAKDCERVLRR